MAPPHLGQTKAGHHVMMILMSGRHLVLLWQRYSEAERAMEQVLKLDKDCEEAVNDLFNCKVLQLMVTVKMVIFFSLECLHANYGTQICLGMGMHIYFVYISHSKQTEIIIHI